MEANMLHKAGTGKIHVDAGYAQPGMIKAALLNFDVDGDQLKPEHRIFPQTKIAPLLQGDNGHIWMQGSASKSWSNTHNMILSRRRVANAAQFLRSLGILDRQMQLDAVGEELAQSHALEDPNDRAVALVVLPVAKESPSPPKNILLLHELAQNLRSDC
jgi:outer membrane protein OmpA-like peptidoglycan-associated protein